MAFVGGTSFVGARVGIRNAAVCSQRVVQRNAKVAVNLSYINEEGNTIVTLNDIKLEEKRKGFTFHSETWNGRAAMLGFVIMLATEVVNPAHPTILQQLGALIGQ